MLEARLKIVSRVRIRVARQFSRQTENIFWSQQTIKKTNILIDLMTGHIRHERRCSSCRCAKTDNAVLYISLY